MRCLLVLCALVAMASAQGDAGRYDPGRYDPGRYNPSKFDQSGRWVPDNSGQYNGDRGTGGGQYDGGYGDRGDRGGAGGFYVPEAQTVQTVQFETLPPVTAAPKPKEHPTNNYQYKYGIGDVEKELLLTLNLEGDSDDLNKAFFEYTNSKDQVYRTDYIADAAHPEHVL